MMNDNILWVIIHSHITRNRRKAPDFRRGDISRIFA